MIFFFLASLLFPQFINVQNTDTHQVKVNAACSSHPLPGAHKKKITITVTYATNRLTLRPLLRCLQYVLQYSGVSSVWNSPRPEEKAIQGVTGVLTRQRNSQTAAQNEAGSRRRGCVVSGMHLFLSADAVSRCLRAVMHRAAKIKQN